MAEARQGTAGKGNKPQPPQKASHAGNSKAGEAAGLLAAGKDLGNTLLGAVIRSIPRIANAAIKADEFGQNGFTASLTATERAIPQNLFGIPAPNLTVTKAAEGGLSGALISGGIAAVETGVNEFGDVTSGKVSVVNYLNNVVDSGAQASVSSATDGTIGAVVGAGIGFCCGGPVGAVAGAEIGQAVGGLVLPAVHDLFPSVPDPGALAGDAAIDAIHDAGDGLNAAGGAVTGMFHSIGNLL